MTRSALLSLLLILLCIGALDLAHWLVTAKRHRASSTDGPVNLS